MDQTKSLVLSTVVEIIAQKDNVIEIFRELKNYLKTIIPCDFIIVLFNNEKARNFYVVPALNITKDYLQKEITIAYHETAITEILRARTAFIRSDLNERGHLTPGDLKFLAQGISSDLSVPIIQKNRVKAVLNLSSFHPNTFTEQHQQIVEDIAIILSLALERLELAEEIQDLKLNLNQWRNKYKRLLENIQQPVAAISSDIDLIYETNSAFERLTGYDANELHGMRYARLHPRIQNHTFNKIISDTTAGKVVELDEMALFRNDGEERIVKVRYFSYDFEKRHLFAEYEDVTAARQQHKVARENYSQLSALIQMGSEILSVNNLELLVISLLDELGSGQGAKYISLHLVDTESTTLKMCCARKLPYQEQEILLPPWSLGLNEGPHQEAYEKNSMIKISNMFEDARSSPWIPIAQKLDYRALVAVPLVTCGRVNGVVTLFYQHVNPFDADSITNLQSAANYFALLIDFHAMKKREKQNEIHLDALLKIIKVIHSHLSLPEVIAHSALEITRVLDFDYLLITIFGELIENYQVYAIASEAAKKLYQIDEWNPIEQTHLGWVHITEQRSNENGKMKKFNQWAQKLQSKIDALLISGDKYYGVVTIASIAPQKYNKQHGAFLDRFAEQLAYAIHQHLDSAVDRAKLDKLGDLKKLSQALNNDLSLEDILQQFMNGIIAYLKADFCSIRFIHENVPDKKATLMSAEPEFPELFRREIEEFIPHIILQKSRFTRDNLYDNEAHKDSLTKQKESWKMYAGIPLIYNDRIFAVVSLYWKHRVQIDEFDLDLIMLIAHQVASLLEKVHLNYECVDQSARLKSSNQELENFVYTVSHELKSPIVSIQGFTTILLNECQSHLDEDSYHYLKRIQSNATMIEKLIKDLLELSRIGRIVSPFEEVCIGDLIAQINDELIYHIEKRKVQLIVDKNLPTIACDKKRMAQVFKNLIDNAIKFIGANNPAPLIEVGYKKENEHHLFYVKDNGIGIAREYFPHIFGLFRGFYQTEQEEHGTGVGLAIVKRIIDSHGGKIWFDSEVNNGTTFFFTIPGKNNANS